MKKFAAFLCLSLVCPSAFAEEEIVLDDVQFKSQSPPGDWNKNLNCGPASALMTAARYLNFTPTTNDIEDVLDWLYDEGYIEPQLDAEYYDGNATNASQLASILSAYYELPYVIQRSKDDLTMLKAKLKKENPVIVGVNIEMNPNKMGHFMVLVGMTKDEVILHDPGKSAGAFVNYPKEKFEKSWATSGFASIVSDVSDATWHPDGSLVQVAGEPEIYQLIGGQLYWIIDEKTFNAHNFDWAKVIFISQKELDCYKTGGQIDWSPYREWFNVGNDYYMLEKSSAGALTCAIYQFSSKISFLSWKLDSASEEVSGAEANEKYFLKCADAGTLFLRDGTVVKPNYAVPNFGSGVIFVATNNGILRPFANWKTFEAMGYNELPLFQIDETEFASSFSAFGEMITESKMAQCLSNADLSVSGQDPASLGATDDADGDGFTAFDGDCDENDYLVFPGADEACDGVDNDCDGAVDEELKLACESQCGAGWQFCSDGEWSLCYSVPSSEVCDDIDNDCDGETDEECVPEDEMALTPEQQAELEKDEDNDGYTAVIDCDDNNASVHPDAAEECNDMDDDCDILVDEGVKNVCGNCGKAPSEICDGIDNDCDGQIDENEQKMCSDDKVCLNGACQSLVQGENGEKASKDATESEPETQESPDTQDSPETQDSPNTQKDVNSSKQEVICTVSCPPGMGAYIWYGEDNDVSGTPAIMSATIENICLRGKPWIDFDCCGPYPCDWEYFDPTVAEVECNHPFIKIIPGLVDNCGEGEIWFTDFQCFPE
ncbi:C39 family peptidase [Candidatus Falkowbacteria bacterium]|nr:C39 family peptidase [Candidatus Falkowbacteria bacterium]